ncbi:MAG: chromate transporter [Lachnospiraceae bacterium]|uniref:Chromate transporter n=1 Tax=Candidatus Weimeria bifida TaxID=2599074 RepID=A0A6N7J1A4_9FIRM|nr:chromate transporter [Candidatus Weimeria bifida]RRF96517.1 MAG: chromate transporter [Lachnospiraceae bacterium]
MDQTAITAAGSSVKEKTGIAKLLFSMFKIGLVGFGGGSALIPVIEQEVVDDQQIVDKKDYDEAVVSACATPGALPVEIAAGVGRRSFGIRGMLLSAVLMALPGAALTVTILALLSGNDVSSLNVIRILSIGIGAFIASLLAEYAVKVSKEARKEGSRNFIANILIITASFMLTGSKSLVSLLGFNSISDHMIKLSTFQILMLAFAVMIVVFAVQSYFFSKKDQSASRGAKAKVTKGAYISLIKENIVWLVFAAVLTIPAVLFIGRGLEYILRGYVSSFMSFGGGDAYLSVADGLFVNTGLVNENDFYGILVPIANVLPGSILTKILSGVGYLIGARSGGAAAGAAGAVAGFAISVAASGIVFGVVYWIMRTFENVSFFKFVSRWINPVIAGLLLGVMVTMYKTNVAAGAALGFGKGLVIIVTVVIEAADIFVMNRKKVGNLLPLLVSAVAGVLALMAF